jgi:hypothetical protein
MKEYNNDPSKRHTHNCYAFAVGYNDPRKIEECKQTSECNTRFHVPGKKSGHPGFSGNLGKRCGDIVARTMADIPEARLSNFSQKCPAGMSKIAVVVDEDSDFHYYAQSKNGYWLHKPGGRAATDKDAAGSAIYRPDLASRYYPAEYEGDKPLNYDGFCSYMCVPRTHPNVIYGGKKKSRKVSKKGSKKHVSLNGHVRQSKQLRKATLKRKN